MAKKHVSCTKQCEFFRKAKDIENMRQDDKITFNEAKKYSKLNYGELSIKNDRIEMMRQT